MAHTRRRARRRRAVAAPAVRRRRRRRQRLGARHARRQGLPRRRSARPSSACSSADFVPAQDVWLSFGCNEEVGGDSAPLAVEELRAPRCAAVVRPRRGRRRRGAGAFPGVEPPARGRRRHREGHHLARARRRGPRRARLHARADGARPPGSPAPSLRLEDAPFPTRTPRADARAAASGWRRTPRAAAAAAVPCRSAAARCSPRALVAAGPESAAMTRTTVGRDDAVRLPRAQRHRVRATRRREHPDHGRRHRGRGDRARPQGGPRRLGRRRGRRAERAEPGLPRPTTTRSGCSSATIARAASRRPCRRPT